MRTIDVSGMKFGILTINRIIVGSLVSCSCDCGTTDFITESYSVRKGLTTSCGCIRLKMLAEGSVHRTHGEGAKGKWSPEYRAWTNMNSRCHNPNSTRYRTWGGRGIAVCAAWRHDFPAFLAYAGRRPSNDHSIDRYPNPDGNYEPGNIRWANRDQQARNRSLINRRGTNGVGI